MKKFLLVSALLGFMPLASILALGLEATPETFDFGWAPRNSRISAEFTITNTSTDMIPLSDLKPACGCTVGTFSPSNLATQEETIVGLTFNTLGYDGISFNKPAKVKTDSLDTEITVTLKGHVTQLEAKLFPLGDGKAHFKSNDSRDTRIVRIQNATDNPVDLSIVQNPADWADVSLSKNKIDPTGTVDLIIKVEGPFAKLQYTSITIEGIENVNVHRFTVAIQTGKPKPRRKITPAQQ